MNLLPHMVNAPICHGTSSLMVDAILKNGICPRKMSGKDSNWKKFESKEDLVYLSTAYPFYFANSACEDGGKPAIFQIDLSRLKKSKFYPDEDFIAQAVAQSTGEDLEKIHFSIRDSLKVYKKYWKASLEGLGNMAYAGVIPVEAIVRYAIVDGKKRPGLSMFMDPSISRINYRFMGGTYERFTNWILGQEKTFPALESAREELEKVSKAYDSAPDNSIIGMLKNLVEQYEREDASRDGIELVEMSPVKKEER